MKKPAALIVLAVIMSFVSHTYGYERADPSTLKGKFMCGYQGWFRTPNDGAGMGWSHYSRLRDEINPDSLIIDMWPDVSELSDEDKVPVPGFKHPDGSQAYVASSHNPRVIDKHFEWMAQYDIDGAWLQHFLLGFENGADATGWKSRRKNMEYVRDAAEKHGRVWAVCFDAATVPSEGIPDILITEWKRIVDAGFTQSPQYLHENGLPVVHYWGFYYENEYNLITPEDAQRLIDFFNADGKYKAALVGGGSWHWGRNPQENWQKLYAQLKYYTPWNVGNYAPREDGTWGASMSFWPEDKAKAAEVGMFWIPVVYPGFSWDNARQAPAGSTNMPRRKGAFLWEQFYEAAKLGVDTFYIAMFDEVDEGTAVFKICPEPPVNAHFIGTEGMPADWYLRLIKEAKRIIKSGGEFPAEIPIKP